MEDRCQSCRCRCLPARRLYRMHGLSRYEVPLSTSPSHGFFPGTSVLWIPPWLLVLNAGRPSVGRREGPDRGGALLCSMAGFAYHRLSRNLCRREESRQSFPQSHGLIRGRSRRSRDIREDGKCSEAVFAQCEDAGPSGFGRIHVPEVPLLQRGERRHDVREYSCC